MGVLSRIAYREQADEFILLGSFHDFLYLARLVAYGDMKRRSQTFVGGGEQHVLQRTPSRSEVVERALLCRPEQGVCFLTEKRNNQQSALHQHFLLFGQRIGKHRHLVLVAGFVHLEYKLSECRHVLGERSDHFRNAFTATHHDELQLAQMVVGRGLERRIDHFFKNFVAYFAIGEIAACTAFLQYFVEIHNVIFLSYAFCSRSQN